MASPELIKDDGKDARDANLTEVAQVDAVPIITSVDNEGPIVTRRELWAYYRA
jgi:hypothetical protein